MDLKEFNKYVQDWDTIEEEHRLDEYSFGGGEQTQPRMLNRNVANKYRQRSGRAIITKQDRQALYKEKDLNKVLPAIDSAFEMIVTAAYGTNLERWLIGQLNRVRNQLKKKVEQQQKRQR